MLKITPVREKEKQKEYCEKCGLPYDADQMCYAAFDDDEFRGISLFRIIDKLCVLYEMKLLDGIDDYLAIYLLAKAPLNFADTCGIKTAVYRGENEKLAKALEFEDKDGIYTLSLEGYFTTPCQRHECH